ncbi:hypothetical protein GCM10007103_24180 [Salinimicrobium marinum]|uniref:PRC-barrel domain-containing protein n=1 Tax=Salinimicrobium marinum TaxID=680283 RepID=A0A918W0W6_9FLAO|nr:photosystem reaction center subunit H [Salinimicrobium marinum]GHA42026.1 hypothetical protein GCM10007103_24180 [Salinimicrobium marinum]
MADKKKNLYYLNELSDWKVDSDDPDVRGWKVKDKDNRVVGKVDNLLVSKSKEKVVYLDVEVDTSIIEANHKPYGKSASADVHEFVNKDGENHLIIPIGHARLNEDEKYVYTDKIDHQTFAETKRKERGIDVDRDYEVVVLESYNRNDGNRNYNEQTTRTADRDLENRSQTTGTSERERRQVDPATESDLDTGRSERTRIANEGEIGNNRASEGRYPDDDSLYEGEDFDRSNYRRRS